MDCRIDIVVRSPLWSDEERLHAIAVRAVRATIRTASPRLAPNSELSLALVESDEIRALNRDWRGKDKTTNVLSFPGSNLVPEMAAGPMLGDIVLSYETVAHEADLEGKPFDHHFSHLIVHGFLHLLGYDHENDTDAELMENLETRTLAVLGIGNPYV